MERMNSVLTPLLHNDNAQLTFDLFKIIYPLSPSVFYDVLPVDHAAILACPALILGPKDPGSRHGQFSK